MRSACRASRASMRRSASEGCTGPVRGMWKTLALSLGVSTNTPRQPCLTDLRRASTAAASLTAARSATMRWAAVGVSGALISRRCWANSDQALARPALWGREMVAGSNLGGFGRGAATGAEESGEGCEAAGAGASAPLVSSCSLCFFMLGSKSWTTWVWDLDHLGLSFRPLGSKSWTGLSFRPISETPGICQIDASAPSPASFR